MARHEITSSLPFDHFLFVETYLSAGHKPDAAATLKTPWGTKALHPTTIPR